MGAQMGMGEEQLHEFREIRTRMGETLTETSMAPICIVLVSIVVHNLTPWGTILYMIEGVDSSKTEEL